MDKTTTEEIVLDDDAKAAIAKDVSETLKPEMDAVAQDAATKAVEAYVAKTEEVNKKAIADKADKDAAAAAAGEVTPEGMAAKSKEARLLLGVKAMVNKDAKTLGEINKINIELREKAGYGNTATDGDGGYLVPDPDFDAEVERLEEQYGVAVRNADVRRINSNSVKLNKKSGSGVTMYETDEAEAKTGTKLSITQVTADLRKFAAIAPVTDELIEDSAVDFWAELTRDFAREDARIDDVLVFTDATSGILEQTGIGAETVGSAITSITWDDLLNASMKVPSPSAQNGKYYMHRTVWNILVQSKPSGGDGHYFFQPNPAGLTTPWGAPVVLTEVLPGTAQDGNNKGFVVFGDLSHVKLYKKRGLDLTILTEGIVKDASGTDFNLALQDGKALRAVARKLAVVKFPEAFCVIGTGGVS